MIEDGRVADPGGAAAGRPACRRTRAQERPVDRAQPGVLVEVLEPTGRRAPGVDHEEVEPAPRAGRRFDGRGRAIAASPDPPGPRVRRAAPPGRRGPDRAARRPRRGRPRRRASRRSRRRGRDCRRPPGRVRRSIRGPWLPWYGARCRVCRCPNARRFRAFAPGPGVVRQRPAPVGGRGSGRGVSWPARRRSSACSLDPGRPGQAIATAAPTVRRLADTEAAAVAEAATDRDGDAALEWYTASVGADARRARSQTAQDSIGWLGCSPPGRGRSLAEARAATCCSRDCRMGRSASVGSASGRSRAIRGPSTWSGATVIWRIDLAHDRHDRERAGDGLVAPTRPTQVALEASPDGASRTWPGLSGQRRNGR